jgi:hypothetical protein
MIFLTLICGNSCCFGQNEICIQNQLLFAENVWNDGCSTLKMYT